MCDLIQGNHPIVLGPNNENIPTLIRIFAEAFFRDAVPTDNPVTIRILNIVRQIQTNEPLFQLCIAGLSTDQQQALHEALSNQPTN